ncbi:MULTISPECIES: hypothetical protein [unclassified Clostridium]|uniref:hypothetical protein n=1 Tax=unclassified Clostridium TaxID=2614128 RepID=UPI000297C314|nr:MULTISPECIES: hypothetical protein [unclassified Clostridium]EKQ56176.1 MAG: hypothetical protein A370_02206 [Clostridium sp. Maddingley MBC34-26]
MKSKKLILGLAMTITMGLGMTAYAANIETTTSTNYTHQQVGLARVTGIRGYDYVEAVLKNKLGMTDAEITAGFNSGKTMYDLAKEKGMTEDEFKAELLEERNQAIGKAVADGTITKEDGDSMKESLQNNMDACTGIPGQGMRKSGISYNSKSGKNASKGHMSCAGSRGLAICSLNDTSN